MRFTKMHGCGNDYIYINLFEEQVIDPVKMAVALSDRHFGIGADGLIFIAPSDTADFRMKMYNADGSEGAMCGNGIRCLAKYVYEHGLTDRDRISVETGAGIKYLELSVQAGKVFSVRVDMGEPDLDAKKIPTTIPRERIVDEPFELDGHGFRMTCVSMGNPHAVVYVEDVQKFAVGRFGPLFEHHPCFPDRVNAEFVQLSSETEISLRVWERGSAETCACGTGACAAVYASIVNGYTDNVVQVSLPGGNLKVEYDRLSGHIFLEGPAAEVFSGETGELA